MKNLILTLVSLVILLPDNGFGQKNEFLLGDHIMSYAYTMNYDSLVENTFGVEQELRLGGINKYVLDTNIKEISLLFEDEFSGKGELLSYEETDSYIKYSYMDHATKLKTDFVTYAVYSKKLKEGEPRLLIYYLSPLDNVTTVCYRSIE